MSDLSTLIRPELVLINPKLATSTAVIKALGTLLVDGGYGKVTLIPAALRREQNYPTGLLLDADGVNAAIPHAEREHVVSAAVAVAILRNPIPFRQMDDPDTEIPVRLVFLLALPDADSQLQTLRSLAGALQNPELISQLLTCAAPDRVISTIAESVVAQ